MGKIFEVPKSFYDFPKILGLEFRSNSSINLSKLLAFLFLIIFLAELDVLY